MTLHTPRPLWVKPRLTEEHSHTVEENAEKVRADVAERQGEEFAEWWASRCIENPVLRFMVAGGNGARRSDLPGGAA